MKKVFYKYLLLKLEELPNLGERIKEVLNENNIKNFDSWFTYPIYVNNSKYIGINIINK